MMQMEVVYRMVRDGEGVKLEQVALASGMNVRTAREYLRALTYSGAISSTKVQLGQPGRLGAKKQDITWFKSDPDNKELTKNQQQILSLISVESKEISHIRSLLQETGYLCRASMFRLEQLGAVTLESFHASGRQTMRLHINEGWSRKPIEIKTRPDRAAKEVSKTPPISLELRKKYNEDGLSKDEIYLFKARTFDQIPARYL